MTIRIAILTLLLCAAGISTATETITRGKGLSVDASNNGRLLIDLVGELWVVPLGGGEAQRIAQDQDSVLRPRWSPDAMRVVYSARSGDRQGSWLHDMGTGETRPIGDNSYLDLHPAWHPDGDRIIYASDRRGTGFDLWETDLPTGLQWRLSNRPGDETGPAWSADGRDLVYVYREGDTWSLILRRKGQPEEVLVTDERRIAGPSWRPDGSLITYWVEDDNGIALNMMILSQPRLIRRYADGEDFTTAPVSWLDRHRMFYSAGGFIRQRLFNSWSSRTVPFIATIETKPAVISEPVRRTLPRVDEPQGTLVVRAARLFDGLGASYLTDRDVVIDGGRITAVEGSTDRPGAIVIDMGDLVVLPGYVDVLAVLPQGTDESTGPLLLASGVTTVIADHDDAEHLSTIWSGKALPGPRLLPAADWAVQEYSGIADSMTPDLDAVLQSRTARLVGFEGLVARRFTDRPIIEDGATSVVLGSRGNGMPAGIALHAELRALAAAGLRPEQALRAAGVNAAAALGVDPVLGRVATGAAADLVFVDGDPLTDVGDALKVVAVVRNGRFFSVAGLIERADATQNVE